jgi:peptidoglycan L-alanyl-D-glutamate endopeptidase CwlK
MPLFSLHSKELLSQADIHLQVLFNEVIKHRDCTITEAFRDEERQNKMFSIGTSKVKWPNGKHNVMPSEAVDVAPYFEKRKGISLVKYEVVEFGHYVLGVRDCLNLTNRIRWGGDWDKDFLTLTDNEFLDAFHWEVIY